MRIPLRNDREAPGQGRWPTSHRPTDTLCLVQYNYTKARVLCRCGFKWDLRVPVRLAVPESLQCHPGMSIDRPTNSRSALCCPECRRTLFSTDSELKACSENEFRGRCESHVRFGTVLLDRR